MTIERTDASLAAAELRRPTTAATVRDAAFDVLRALGLTTIFSNPGSTEVPLLAGLPDDLTFVLGLHEGAVVAMAAGHALGRQAPALALLHSTPGLGNAVAALATARTNRAPVVVVVGQQDRRHLALDPFLAGRLARPGRRVPGARRAAGAPPGRPRRPRPGLPRGADPPRPRDRDRPDGRLARARRRAARDHRPRPRDALTGRRSRRGRGARRAARRGRVARHRGRRRQRRRAPAGPASRRWPRGSPARSSRSRSAARPASPRTTRASPATCRPAAPGCARRSPPTTSCWWPAPTRSASTPSTRARWSTRAPSSPCSPRTPPRRTAARPTWP